MGPRPTTGAASGGQKGAGEGGKDDVKRASRSKSRFSAKKNGLKSQVESRAFFPGDSGNGIEVASANMKSLRLGRATVNMFLEGRTFIAL